MIKLKRHTSRNGFLEAIPKQHGSGRMRNFTLFPSWMWTTAQLAPGDKKAFFYTLPAELVNKPMLAKRTQYIALATTTIGKVFPMLDKPKQTGANYHPLWRQISDAWVSMNANPHTVAACLETPWNTEGSTVEGYKAVGAALAKSVQQYLATRLLHGG